MADAIPGIVRRPEKLGTNHLLIIGIDEYPHCPRLNNCKKDAQAVADTLHSRYEFNPEHTKYLYNEDATRRNILFELEAYSEKIGKTDNLIIYFSGHGELKNNIGFWIPFDAYPKYTADFITTHDITSRLNAVKSLHTLLIVDACFSGSIFLQRKTVTQLKEYTKPSRLGFTSSHSRETALDGLPGDNSPFAAELIKELKRNTEPLSVAQLAERVKNGMENKTKQMPIFKPIDVEGDDLGAFVFFPREDEVATWQAALAANSFEAYSAYCTKYRGGKYFTEALAKMEELEEQAIWDRVDKTRPSALLLFINENPNSPFLSQAQQRYDELSKLFTTSSAPKKEEPIRTSAQWAGNILTPTMPDHMVFIKGTTEPFMMGDVMGDKEYDDETVHPVMLSDFLLAKYQLTFDEYDLFCKDIKKELPSDEGWGRGQRPVINVYWQDAIEYCNWRSKQEGLQPVFDIQKKSVIPDWKANGYRLPTEAEWEYAAREGGKVVRFGNGKNFADPKEINFNGSKESKKDYSVVGEYRSKTVPVGSLQCPNALGLHDMSGNVQEWCWDWFGNYPTALETDPKGPDSGSYRVFRGGSWLSVPQYVRAAYRDDDTPDYRSFLVGFRLARTRTL
jgi:formylglycine-generating enzyme required for sulfatase activity